MSKYAQSQVRQVEERSFEGSNCAIGAVCRQRLASRRRCWPAVSCRLSGRHCSTHFHGHPVGNRPILTQIQSSLTPILESVHHASQSRLVADSEEFLPG